MKPAAAGPSRLPIGPVWAARRAVRAAVLAGGLCLIAGLTAPPARGEETAVLVTVSASSRTARFTVDGKTVTGAAAFSWTAGSQHTLAIEPLQEGLVLNSRFRFLRWTSATGVLGSAAATVSVTASRTQAWFKAELETEYALQVRFNACSASACAEPGTLYVNQTAYTRDADVWLTAGTTVTVEASAGAGYVFAGWGQGGVAAVRTFPLDAPVTVTPLFLVGRRVNLSSSPPGMVVVVDTVELTTPATLVWVGGSRHTLSVASPQKEPLQGRMYAFHAWSDGGAASRTYQVGEGSTAIQLGVEFLPAESVTLATVPAGLALAVDGVSGPAPRNLYWAPGESHTVEAPEHQLDSSGAPWVFESWSNGGARAQQVRAGATGTGHGGGLVATYRAMARVKIESSPTGLALLLDGSSCRTPCDVERPPGAVVRLAAPASFAVTDGTRLEFDAWDSGAAREWDFTAPAGLFKAAVRYRTAHRLQLSSRPGAAGTWRVSPASGDAYFASGTAVTVEFQPAAGFRFRKWEYDLEGSANPVTLVMDAPRAIRAVAEATPGAEAPPRVQNAAGETPSPAVAAGSIASLFGGNLASGTEASAGEPLAQKLGGTVLVCAGRILPLVFASPTQVNFQVPAGLEAGEYKIEIHRAGAGTLEATLAVARFAPGLFSQPAGTRPQAMAMHADGTPVSTESPARRGELITVPGTGFGPLLLPPPDGFAAAPPVPAEHPVEVSLEGLAAEVVFAGSTTGAPGIQEVRFRVPAAVPDGDLTLTATAGGVTSNSVTLPVR